MDTDNTAPYARDDIYAEADRPKEPEPAPGHDDEKSDEENDAALVERAKECFRFGMECTSRWRKDALLDLQFRAGEQWESNVRAQRDQQGRPALTINRMPQFVRRVTNEQRQAKASITVSPRDTAGSKRTAEVLQGVIRDVEYTSNADSAYAAGGESAATTGLGYWDVAAEYEDERSFEQHLVVRRMRNPMGCLMDPSAKELAGDDATWCLISSDMTKAEFKAAFPGKEDAASLQRWSGGTGDTPEEWVFKDGVRLHEFRYVTEEPDTLYDISGLEDVHKLAMKMTGVDVSSGGVLASEIGPQHAATLDGLKTPTRPTTRRKVCWAKIVGDKVVKKGELAGKYLQLVRVVGTELEIDGRVIYEGVIRHARDPQRALNYYVSAQTEAIALAPKAPWLVAEGQIPDAYKEQWQTSNTKTPAYLTYKPTSLAGQTVPPPQRIQAEANIQAISTSVEQTNHQMSDVTDIYPTQYGAPAPEQSGKAILARESQGATGNFHFTDNYAMAIRYTGRILVDLIPKIYSGPRILRIIGEDGNQQMVPVNGHPEQQEVIALDAGRYDVAVSMGPSYQSRRAEAAAQTMELARANPQVGQFCADLIVRNLDIPGGDQMADRLEKMLPPQLQPPQEKQPPPQMLAQMVQQMNAELQKNAQVIQMLGQHLNNAQDKLDTKQQDIESKERIALLNAQVELLKTKAQLNSADANQGLDRLQADIHKRLELDGMGQPMDDASTKERPTAPAEAPKRRNPKKRAASPLPPPQGAPHVASGQPAPALAGPTGALPGPAGAGPIPAGQFGLGPGGPGGGPVPGGQR